MCLETGSCVGLKSEDEMGLVNGSMGAIYDITWEDYGQFDEYTGPAFPTL